MPWIKNRIEVIVKHSLGIEGAKDKLQHYFSQAPRDPAIYVESFSYHAPSSSFTFSIRYTALSVGGTPWIVVPVSGNIVIAPEYITLNSEPLTGMAIMGISTAQQKIKEKLEEALK